MGSRGAGSRVGWVSELEGVECEDVGPGRGAHGRLCLLSCTPAAPPW